MPETHCDEMCKPSYVDLSDAFHFQLLLLFLCRIIAKQKENKMDLNNVAMIMAPNLFLNTGNKSGVTLREAEMAKGTINIVRMLIKYHAILWTVGGTHTYFEKIRSLGSRKIIIIIMKYTMTTFGIMTTCDVDVPCTCNWSLKVTKPCSVNIL